MALRSSTSELGTRRAARRCADASSQPSSPRRFSMNPSAPATSNAIGRPRSSNRVLGHWRACGRAFSTDHSHGSSIPTLP